MSTVLPLVRLPGTQLSVSRFIFGTAALFNVGRQAKRVELLEAAVHAGFSHFDTAPYYGFGWAERDLGELLQRHPQLTITSKVGIYSPGGEESSYAMVLLRKAAGRFTPVLSRPSIDFSVARAQSMLNASLARLNTQRIALYMLHEPDLGMVQTDEWQRWLEAEVGRGRIGTYGLALTREKLQPFLDAGTALAPVVQILDSLDESESDCLIDAGRCLQITYGYVSAARKKDPTRQVEDVLVQALSRNREGAIIVSTTKISRLAQYSKLLKKSSS